MAHSSRRGNSRYNPSNEVGLNMDVCSADFDGMIGNIMLVSAYAAFLTTGIILLGYMLGQALSNPKVTVWAKTELLQVVISIAAVFILLNIVSSFCALDAKAFNSFGPNIPSGSIYTVAEENLKTSATYVKDVVSIQSYYSQAHDMLSARSKWGCGDTFECMFAAVGTNRAYYAFANTMSAAFSVTFNATLLSYFSVMNFLFILKIIYSGFILFFLPLGILLRSLPFTRTVGSLFIALTFAFFLVYPSILAIFSPIVTEFLMSYGTPSQHDYTDDSHLHIGFSEAFGSSFEWDEESDSYLEEYIFDYGNRNEPEALKLAGRAFIIGVFLPTIAFLASIAAVSYSAKLIGEEIDLSRVVQLV